MNEKKQTPYNTFINGYRLFEMTITPKDNNIPPYKQYIVAISIKEALAISGEYCADYLTDVRVIDKGWVVLQKD